MLHALIRIVVFLAALLPTAVLAVDHYVPATRDEPALYPVGSIVRVRCDGGTEMKLGSIYGSEQAVEAALDPNVDMPRAARHVHWGTRLRVTGTRRWQSYTPISHTKYLNYQILELEPLSGPPWRGYLESLSVDPDDGSKSKFDCE